MCLPQSYRIAASLHSLGITYDAHIISILRTCHTTQESVLDPLCLCLSPLAPHIHKSAQHVPNRCTPVDHDIDHRAVLKNALLGQRQAHKHLLLPSDSHHFRLRALLCLHCYRSSTHTKHTFIFIQFIAHHSNVHLHDTASLSGGWHIRRCACLPWIRHPQNRPSKPGMLHTIIGVHEDCQASVLPTDAANE
jgi:hypothetical protein